MDQAYDPKQVESTWYSRWEQAGVFRPELNPGGDPFCIVIPPPNVTGSLHMGHALDQTIQDVIIRRKRMQGYAALWLPGTDMQTSQPAVVGSSYLSIRVPSVYVCIR